MFLIEGDGKAIIYTGDIRGQLGVACVFKFLADLVQLRHGG
jgi:hypothetical protein